jgi:hypothetical protein
MLGTISLAQRERGRRGEPEPTVCVFVNLPLTSHILGIARGTGGARRALIYHFPQAKKLLIKYLQLYS